MKNRGNRRWGFQKPGDFETRARKTSQLTRQMELEPVPEIVEEDEDEVISPPRRPYVETHVWFDDLFNWKKATLDSNKTDPTYAVIRFEKCTLKRPVFLVNRENAPYWTTYEAGLLIDLIEWDATQGGTLSFTNVDDLESPFYLGSTILAPQRHTDDNLYITTRAALHDEEADRLRRAMSPNLKAAFAIDWENAHWIRVKLSPKMNTIQFWDEDSTSDTPAGMLTRNQSRPDLWTHRESGAVYYWALTTPPT